MPKKPDLSTLSETKEESKSTSPMGSKVKMSLGGGGGQGSLLGKRPAGTITMKLKPQVIMLLL